MHHPVVLRLLPLLLWLCGTLLALPSHAGDPAPTPAPAYTSYTSRAGDTIEKIVSQQYAGSPLQAQVLARHVLDANTALAKTPSRKRLKTGTALQLPTHEQVLRKAMAPYLPANAFEPAPHNGPEARRSWVHYP